MPYTVVQGGRRSQDGSLLLSQRSLALVHSMFPKGVTWRRHLEPLMPRHGIQEDDDPGDTSTHDSNSSYLSLGESYSDTLSS